MSRVCSNQNLRDLESRDVKNLRYQESTTSMFQRQQREQPAPSSRLVCGYLQGRVACRNIPALNNSYGKQLAVASVNSVSICLGGGEWG